MVVVLLIRAVRLPLRSDIAACTTYSAATARPLSTAPARFQTKVSGSSSVQSVRDASKVLLESKRRSQLNRDDSQLFPVSLPLQPFPAIHSAKCSDFNGVVFSIIFSFSNSPFHEHTPFPIGTSPG